jgi:hypothetical protein
MMGCLTALFTGAGCWLGLVAFAAAMITAVVKAIQKTKG